MILAVIKQMKKNYEEELWRELHYFWGGIYHNCLSYFITARISFIRILYPSAVIWSLSYTHHVILFIELTSLNSQPLFSLCPGSHGPLPKIHLNSFAVYALLVVILTGQSFHLCIITQAEGTESRNAVRFFVFWGVELLIGSWWSRVGKVIVGRWRDLLQLTWRVRNCLSLPALRM